MQLNAARVFSLSSSFPPPLLRQRTISRPTGVPLQCKTVFSRVQSFSCNKKPFSANAQTFLLQQKPFSVRKIGKLFRQSDRLLKKCGKIHTLPHKILEKHRRSCYNLPVCRRQIICMPTTYNNDTRAWKSFPRAKNRAPRFHFNPFAVTQQNFLAISIPPGIDRNTAP